MEGWYAHVRFAYLNIGSLGEGEVCDEREEERLELDHRHAHADARLDSDRARPVSKTPPSYQN